MALLPSWADAKRIAIDCETRDEHLKTLGIGVRRGGYITGVAFAIDGGPKFYLPYRHAGGDNLPEDAVLRYLRENGKAFSGELVGANLSYDLDYLWEEDIFFPQVEFYRDVQIADPLIYELHNSFSLDEIGKRHGFEGKQEQLLREAAAEFGVDPKKGMWRLPARYVGEYAEMDVDMPLGIMRVQEKKLADIQAQKVWDLESKVLPILVKMRRRGVRIDEEKLTKIEEWTLQEETSALAIVKESTGYSIEVGDVWKSKNLAPPLQAIGVSLSKTSTGEWSVDQDAMSSIDHPVAHAIAWARKVNKLRTTFAASVRTYMVNGRIHCTFNQIARETESGDQKGARYGRLSCTDPNLQQQPSRDEFAKMWRSIYIAEEGALWACNDYSQQEPRWTTHFAAVMDLPKAREAAQAYHDDPMIDNHQFMADLTGLKRTFAKNLYLGLCYGEGGAKLCEDLGLPTRWALRNGKEIQYFEEQYQAMQARSELGRGYIWRAAGEEGQNIIDQFNERAPFIGKLAEAAKERVEANGYIRTPYGRRLHFPLRSDGSYDWTHKSLNRLIQGTSADQTKAALVEIEAAGHFMQLQVHDEINCSVPNEKAAKEIAEIMANVVKGEVPFRVDTEVGPNWGDIK